MASPLRLAVIRPRRLDALRAFTQSLVLPNSDELSLCYKQVRKAHVDMTRNDQFRRIASYRSMWRRQGGWLPAGRQAGCSKGINTKCLVPLISVINWCHKDRSGEEVKKKYFMMLGQMETRQDFCEEMCHIYNATYQLQVGKIHQPGMQRRFICCCIRRSRRTPLPLALVAICRCHKAFHAKGRPRMREPRLTQKRAT